MSSVPPMPPSRRHREAAGRRQRGRGLGEPNTSSVPGHSRTVPDLEILALGRAPKHCGVRQGIIMRLVTSGILVEHQIIPRAPWEIRRADLDSPEVQRVLKGLRATGKSGLRGVHTINQQTLFETNQGDGNGRRYDSRYRSKR